MPNGDGGGIYVSHSVVKLTNNVFTGNEADNGGGIGLADFADIDITHNSVIGNKQRDAKAGAVYIHDRVTRASVVNNLIYANEEFQILEPFPRARIDNNLLRLADGVTPVILVRGLYFSYATNNLDTAAALNSDGRVNAAFNIDGDPQLRNLAANDFSLLSSSPAIGAATTNNIAAVSTDIRPMPRSTPTDIGAYEHSTNLALVSDPVLSGSAQVSDSLFITSGTWGPAPGVVTYQWNVDRVAVPGATGAAFAPRVEDVGKPVNVVVTSTKFGVYTRSFTSNITTPVTRGAHFADVPTSQPFYLPIMWMYDRGISTGSQNLPYAPLFKPSDPVSRQVMAAFLYRLSGETFIPPVDPSFADVTVENSPQFYTAIEWMSSKRISTGTAQPEGKPLYKPAGPVSREVMGIFLARFASVNVSVPPTELSFADVPVNSQYAAALAWMKATGISTGTAQPSGLPLYKPQDPVSRQALSAFLFRFDNLP